MHLSNLDVYVNVKCVKILPIL